MRHRAMFYFVLITIVLGAIFRVENAFGDPRSDIYLFWYNETTLFNDPPSTNTPSPIPTISFQKLDFNNQDKISTFNIGDDRKGMYTCLAFEPKDKKYFINTPNNYLQYENIDNPFQLLHSRVSPNHVKEVPYFYLFYFKKPFLENKNSFTFDYYYQTNDHREKNQLIFTRQDNGKWKIQYVPSAPPLSEEHPKTSTEVEDKAVEKTTKSNEKQVDTTIIKMDIQPIKALILYNLIIPFAILAIFTLIPAFLLFGQLINRVGDTRNNIEKISNSFNTFQTQVNGSIEYIKRKLTSITTTLEEIKTNAANISLMSNNLANIDTSLLDLKTISPNLQSLLDEVKKYQLSVLDTLPNINNQLEELVTTAKSQRDQETVSQVQTSVLPEDPSIKIKNKWDNILKKYKMRVEPIFTKHKEIQESLKKASNAQYANELNAITSYVRKSHNLFQEIVQYQYPVIDPLVEDLEEAYKRLFLSNVQSELVNKALDAFFELYTYCQRSELENLRKEYPGILSIIESELFQVIQEFLAKQKMKMMDIKLYETTFEPSYHKPVDSQPDDKYDNNVILKVFKAGLTNLEGNQVKRLAEVVVNKLKDIN